MTYPTPAERLRALPAVDRLLNLPEAADPIALYGRDTLRDALRAELDARRRALIDGLEADPSPAAILAQATAALAAEYAPSLRPVINATGVIVHTNLGRAPLSQSALRAMLDAATGYSTLEYDLPAGKRGKRDVHAESIVTAVTGAEAALVVNNNAAAITLILAALAGEGERREAVLSRGQLVEIGGGFRMPDVMAQSGAVLVEVGTTNRTRADDFRRAITPRTAMLLRVHASNFKQIGFVEQPTLEELADLAHANGTLAVDDLGSGALLDTAPFGLSHEPTVQESLRAGFDLVCFSGDKLLGGPQAGIIVGRADLVEQLKKHPLARAFRLDKLCLAGLVATLEHYRRGEPDVLANVPIWRMISTPPEAIRARAEAWTAHVGGAVIPTESTVGGGSLPGESLPTYALALTVPNADTFAAMLRSAPTPIIARIADGRVLFDPRTVFPDQESALLGAIQQAQKEIRP